MRGGLALVNDALKRSHVIKVTAWQRHSAFPKSYIYVPAAVLEAGFKAVVDWLRGGKSGTKGSC